MARGIVFDIQRYSLQDGPGLRTLVFLKGCPLRCLWCSNPESQRFEPQLLYDGDRCTLCLTCVPACPSGALTSVGPGALSYDLTRCTCCGKCVRVCPNAARRTSGESMTIEQVVAIVLRDAPFYRRSGGGVTLGGGEPTAQPEFARLLLEACSRNHLDTAIETCGHAETRAFLAVAEAADHVFFDIKHAEAARHQELTGVPNGLILDNLRAVLHRHSDVTVRYPLVPRYNDSTDDLTALSRCLLRLPRMPRVEIIPYHQFGEHKYRLLGRPYTLTGTPACSWEDANNACAVLGRHGISFAVLEH